VATTTGDDVEKEDGQVVHDPVSDLRVVLIPRERHGGYGSSSGSM
jgi:hypothetical protein